MKYVELTCTSCYVAAWMHFSVILLLRCVEYHHKSMSIVLQEFVGSPNHLLLDIRCRFNQL